MPGRVFTVENKSFERYQNGEKAHEIATAFGISVRTVYKWLKRFREHGPSGLIARSSAPRNLLQCVYGWVAEPDRPTAPIAADGS